MKPNHLMPVAHIDFLIVQAIAERPNIVFSIALLVLATVGMFANEVCALLTPFTKGRIADQVGCRLQGEGLTKGISGDRFAQPSFCGGWRMSDSLHTEGF